MDYPEIEASRAAALAGKYGDIDVCAMLELIECPDMGVRAEAEVLATLAIDASVADEPKPLLIVPTPSEVTALTLQSELRRLGFDV